MIESFNAVDERELHKKKLTILFDINMAKKMKYIKRNVRNWVMILVDFYKRKQTILIGNRN